MDIFTLYQEYLKNRLISTDSRNIAPGSLFFALKGEKFDANAFALEALEKGARLALVDNPDLPPHDRIIQVENVLSTLQELARYHRSQLSIPVIGLTGSNGKTTSKELVRAVLNQKFKVWATQGNLNNHIGVPLTLLSILPEIEIAVVEMGANHLGEIALLCQLAQPTHGFITNIGKAHLGTFGSMENILRGKSELYHYLIEHKGTLFVHSQNPVLLNMAKRAANPIFYPAGEDFSHTQFLAADPYIRFRGENGEVIHTALLGAYNFENIAVALCVGKYFEVDPTLANAAIRQYLPSNMRSQVIKKGSNTILLDAYNANPSSMVAALDNFSSMKGAHKLVVLGDMFELGNHEEAEHRSLGTLLAKYDFDEVYLCGPLMKFAWEEIPDAHYFPHTKDLKQALKKHPIHQSTLLIKGSRGMGLENILEEIHE